MVPKLARIGLAASIALALIATMVPSCASGGSRDRGAASSPEGDSAERANGAAGDTSATPAPPPELPAGYSMRQTARRVLKPVIWLAGVSAVLSILLRFTPVGAWLGGKATAGAVAAFVGGLALLYAVERYGVLFAEIAIWASVAMGVAAAIPWLIAFYRRNLAKVRAATGVELAIKGHADAGVAFIADALPSVLTGEKRKSLLSRLIDEGDEALDDDDRARRVRELMTEFGVKLPRAKRRRPAHA
jgi:hypothetical protein